MTFDPSIDPVFGQVLKSLSSTFDAVRGEMSRLITRHNNLKRETDEREKLHAEQAELRRQIAKDTKTLNGIRAEIAKVFSATDVQQ